ncbi:Cyclin-dependent kinase F-3 [Zostera marina]|uniref:cyclin-dependent kinase n=1 Tax=Zostera marina TaxID=29655 RepID=A0A0K9P492_ZOSMR|nr:Cyclin-dependent kinase F-3 [Zostera marina]
MYPEFAKQSVDSEALQQLHKMDKYVALKTLGDGSCGIVYKAINLETKEIVAIKKMKNTFNCWEECRNLREINILSKLNHPSVVGLKEVVMENHVLYMIFEYMECNLFEKMGDGNNKFSEAEIRNIMKQFLQGLSYIHNEGYIHRDLKPENLLVRNDIIKVADFGLARDVLSGPPFTNYVSTRWYRAPEILLRSPSYTMASDMWSVGAILAELFMSSPLFPGESETDQILKICSILGSPDYTSWPDGIDLARAMNFNFYEIGPKNISHIIQNASSEAIDLIMQLCSWDPSKRPTAAQALQHPFFDMRSFYHPASPFQTGEHPMLAINVWDYEYLNKQSTDDCSLGLSLAVKPSIPDIHRPHQSLEDNMLGSRNCLHEHNKSARPGTSMEDISLELSLSLSY